MTDAPTPTPAGELGYAEAVAELETILAGLEGADPDVDRLAAQVARAAELIAECRDRLAATRFEVDRIVADLHPQAPGTEPDGR